MRRTNKSAKVPNVKLRPAAPLARRASTPETFRLHDSDDLDAGQDVSFTDRVYRPFKGIVICATGVSDKTALFKQAIELGATALSDLTDKVSHLLAVEPGSAKFKCALENKIPIMHPSWITDSHDIWLRGDEFDLAESVASHRLPIFSGVVLCLSGIEDIARRTEINRLVTAQGGTYVKQLERPVRVTHLLCASTAQERTEKMRYAEKFNQRGEANIHLVWEEWFWDSLRYGGRFDEETYKASNPPPPRKTSPPGTPPPSSSPVNDYLGLSSSQPAVPRVIDHSALLAGDEEEEVVSVKRVPEVTLQIWHSILKPRGFEMQEGRLVRSPTKSQPAPGSGTKRTQRLASQTRSKSEHNFGAAKKWQATTLLPTSALSTFKRTNSFAPAAPAACPLFARAPAAGPSSSLIMNPSTEKGKEKATAIFAGLTFRTLGEARCASVRSALEDNGGRLVSDETGEEVSYIIVRLVSGNRFYQEEPDQQERVKYRTECWLEKCIFDERICEASEHISFVPLKVQTPIVGAEAVNMSFSGLDQSETISVRRLLRAIGAKQAQNFSRRSTHLLCESRTGAKADKAREWGVPIVGMAWLAEMVSSGLVPPVRSSLAEDVSPASPSKAGDAVVAGLVEAEADFKGKGKMRAASSTTDIAAQKQSTPEQVEDPAIPVSQAVPRTAEPLPVDGQADEPFGHPSLLLGPATSSQLSYASPPAKKSALTTSSVGRLAESSAPPSELATPDLASEMEYIPSSKSPSPMKLPPEGSSRPSTPVTKRVLHESITTLLGKRPSSGDEPADTAQEQHSRAGKRARPPSKQKIVFGSPRESSSESAMAAPALAPGDEDLSFLDAGIGEQSMRIMYEDAGQEDEKKRLMRLLMNL